jgi:hypothetical protein
MTLTAVPASREIEQVRSAIEGYALLADVCEQVEPLIKLLDEAREAFSKAGYPNYSAHTARGLFDRMVERTLPNSRAAIRQLEVELRRLGFEESP